MLGDEVTNCLLMPPRNIKRENCFYCPSGGEGNLKIQVMVVLPQKMQNKENTLTCAPAVSSSASLAPARLRSNSSEVKA